MEKILPNRIAVYLTAAAAIAAALAPVIADMDWESTAGVIAGLVAILGVVTKWLDGWSKYERGEGQALIPGELEDDFDEETAEPIPDQVIAAAHVPVPPGEPPPPAVPPETRPGMDPPR